MQRPAPHPVEGSPLGEFCEEPPSPIQIAAVWSGADECEIYTEPRHPFGKAPIFTRVLFGSEVAAAAPRLVADAPETHVERRAIATAFAKLCKSRAARRRIAVLNPLVEIFRGQTTQVRRK